MLSDLVNALECLAARRHAEFRGPKVTAEVLDSPDNSPGFKVKWCPIPLVVEGGAADEQDGTDRTFKLILLERCAKAVLAGVAILAERIWELSATASQCG